MAQADVYCETGLNFYSGDVTTSVDVNIRNGRAVRNELDYEQCGFTLLTHQSDVRDWLDESELQRVHGPEIAQLARDFSGCDQVVVYPPLVRSPTRAASHDDFGPIEAVHSDFTEDYRLMVQEPGRPYRRFLDPLLAAAGLSRDDVENASRLLMLQFWRNIGETFPDRPFALCDASTVPRTELAPYLVPEYGGEKLEFETFMGLTPQDAESQRWYTFPGLKIDEVIAFRTYDSRCEQEGRPFWTPHSAFVDPTVGAGAPQRESLEMRVLCLFSD
jgi:hypothetical protein